MHEAPLGQSGLAGRLSCPQLLDELVEAEKQRSRRLTRIALAFWASWLFVGALPFGLNFASPNLLGGNWLAEYIELVVIGMFLIGVPLLPIIAVVLVILAVLARRAATLTQMRGSPAVSERS